MKKTFLSFAIIAGMIAYSATAEAAIISFFLYGNGGAAPSYTFTNDGVTVTATAYYNNLSNTADVYQTPWGLGVENSSADSIYLDGSTRDDILKLHFSEAVNLTSISFMGVDSNDDFLLFVDTFDSSPELDTAVLSLVNVSSYNFYGTDYYIQATDSDDEYKVKSLKIETNDKPETPPVPEPATMLLFGTGLLGLGFRRKYSA